MREIDEESVSVLLENKEALAPCNVAAFVYDRCVLHCLYCMLPGCWHRKSGCQSQSILA